MNLQINVPDLWIVKANYHAVPDIQYQIRTNFFIISMKILYRKISVYSYVKIVSGIDIFSVRQIILALHEIHVYIESCKNIVSTVSAYCSKRKWKSDLWYLLCLKLMNIEERIGRGFLFFKLKAALMFFQNGVLVFYNCQWTQ